MTRNTSVFAVDLAHRAYDSMGFAFLAGGSSTVQFVQPADLGLMDPPEPKLFAHSLEAFCRINDVSVLLLDGPQGWKSERSGIEHMRLCERVLNTPGRSGLPGEAKPRTYLPFIQFSITLYDYLRRLHGWRLLTEDWAVQRPRRWLVECFPTSSWKTLGLTRLPGKSRATPQDLDAWCGDLERTTELNLPPNPTHDQLQAAAVLPVGKAIVEQAPARVLLSGMNPLFTPEGVREGWIANPILTDV